MRDKEGEHCGMPKLKFYVQMIGYIRISLLHSQNKCFGVWLVCSVFCVVFLVSSFLGWKTDSRQVGEQAEGEGEAEGGALRRTNQECERNKPGSDFIIVVV